MKSPLHLARRFGVAALLTGLHLQGAFAAPTSHQNHLDERKTGDRLVVAHFMMGIVGNRASASDYDADMKLAHDMGIDAFALNIGTDEYTDEQLDFAYESAANNDMQLFISFDFNWYDKSSEAAAAEVGVKIAKYASKDAQLKVDGKVFASTFTGNGVDVDTIREGAGDVDIFFAPNFNPNDTPDPGKLDAAFNWMAWPNDGNNKAPGGTDGNAPNVTVEDGDQAFLKWLGPSKAYMAPASPWFFTHYGPEVEYSKNWVFPSDLLWYDRWTQLLKLKESRFVEIITWNDFGESHYIAPLSSKHFDDGNSKWVNDMPHEGWMDMAKPFIAAYKAGAEKADEFIEEDQIIYWYRPNLKTLDCDETDTTMAAGPAAKNDSGNFFKGRPQGYESMKDAVFVVSLLQQAGTIRVKSGSNQVVEIEAPAGAHAQEVPMAVGKQTFELVRGGKTVFSGTSLRDVTSSCSCGLYNYNAYVGQLPFKPFASLNEAGLASLTVGVSDQVTCEPEPTIDGSKDDSGSGPIPTESSDSSPSSSASSIGTLPTPSYTFPNATSIVAMPTAFPTTGTNPDSTAITSSSYHAAQPTGSVGKRGCIKGTKADGLPDDYLGLCSFACSTDYCPPTVCKCTEYGNNVVKVAATKPPGCPAKGKDDGFAGLCAHSCARDYCPNQQCVPTCDEPNLDVE